MDIWESNKILLFIIFIIPGFVSLKVYDLLTPSTRKEISKYLIDAIAYSCVNYALISPVLLFSIPSNVIENNILFSISLISVLFIFPILWAILFFKLRRSAFISKYTPHPTPKPWDYVFGKKESYWVIICLTGDEFSKGEKIGGVYDTNSFASSFPHPEQIYLEELWEIDEGENFVKAIARSKGAIFSTKDIKYIKFLE